MHSLCPGDREDKVELEEERRSIDVARLHKKMARYIKNIPLMYFFSLRENNVLQRERKYLFALSRSWATLWIFLWTGLVLVLTMVPYWKKQNINNRLLSFVLALSFPITKRYRQQHHHIKKTIPYHLPRRFCPTTTKSKYERNTATATNIWKKNNPPLYAKNIRVEYFVCLLSTTTTTTKTASNQR